MSLGDELEGKEGRVQPEGTDCLMGFPYRWQVPAATEKAAFDSMKKTRMVSSACYIGAPWATVIDGLSSGLDDVDLLLEGIGSVVSECPGDLRRATVCQHIRALDYIDLFRMCGITDLFWSHKRIGVDSCEGIALHPFPLFPAQTHCHETGRRRDIASAEPGGRPWFANFVGAYNASIYLSDVRGFILGEGGRDPDVLVIERTGWHFERSVYKEQMRRESTGVELQVEEMEQAREYVEALVQSEFTICPTGSGPNSIRIYEALAAGSIPIILTRELDLAGPRSLWEGACVIEEDSKEGYRRALEKARALGTTDVSRMRKRCEELCEMVSPNRYREIIESRLFKGVDASAKNLARRVRGPMPWSRCRGAVNSFVDADRPTERDFQRLDFGLAQDGTKSRSEAAWWEVALGTKRRDEASAGTGTKTDVGAQTVAGTREETLVRELRGALADGAKRRAFEFRVAVNQLSYGDGCPFPEALIYIHPADVTYVVRDLIPRIYSGAVVAGDWDQRVTELRCASKYIACLNRFERGLDWRAAGVEKLFTHLFAQEARPDGCSTWQDVWKRYAGIDELYADVKKKGRLVPRGVRAGPLGRIYRDGVYIHVGRTGDLIFGCAGYHRLAVAKILGLESIPAQLGVVHIEAFNAEVWRRKLQLMEAGARRGHGKLGTYFEGRKGPQL